MGKKFTIPIMILSLLLIHGCKKEAPDPPVITTTTVNEISYTTATAGGNVTSEGGAAVTSRGVCWNTSKDPTIDNSKTTETGSTGEYTSKLTQLAPNTLYYVRAYATNSGGTSYGSEVTFTTSKIEVPVLNTEAVTSITQTSAVSGGNITDEKGSPVTARGVCWSTNLNPTILDNKTSDGTGPGSFVSNITGLTGHTLYHIRAYATNVAGTQYGTQVTFGTSPVLPSLTTDNITYITYTTAHGGGYITNDGGSIVTERGICWNTAENPTISNNKSVLGDGTGPFENTISGLAPNTMYYVKAYATNSAGTQYGNQVSFTTNPLTVTDADGNLYNVVHIGNQFWMKENLKTTKYQNGDLIGTTMPATLNLNYESMKKFQWAYDGNEANVTTFGRLYTWYAVTDDRKVCPLGWHVPSDGEWAILESFLGGPNIAGGKLKETGTINWINPNAGANNEIGFTALPSGGRALMGIFEGIGIRSVLWTSTEKNIPGTNSTVFALSRTMVSNNSIIYSSVIYNKLDALAVRCLMDQ